MEEWQHSTWHRSRPRLTKASWMAENRLKTQGAPQGGWVGDEVKWSSQQDLVWVYSPALFRHPVLCVLEDSGRTHYTPLDLSHGAATPCGKHDHYRLQSQAVQFQTRHSHCVGMTFLMCVDVYVLERRCFTGDPHLVAVLPVSMSNMPWDV